MDDRDKIACPNVPVLFSFRQLAHTQLIRFKKAPGFHWLNVAPNGSRLPVDRLSRAVADWFDGGVPLPSEWDGKNLQILVRRCVMDGRASCAHVPTVQ